MINVTKKDALEALRQSHWQNEAPLNTLRKYVDQHDCEHGISGEACPDCIKEYIEDELVFVLNAKVSEQKDLIAQLTLDRNGLRNIINEIRGMIR